MDRRREKRDKKTFVLSASVIDMLHRLSAKYGISEAAVVSIAITQFGSREDIGADRDVVSVGERKQ